MVLVNLYFLHGHSREAEECIYDRATTKPFVPICIKLQDFNFYK